MWDAVVSKNAKKKIQRAYNRGDMRELARRSAVFRDVDPNWVLPDDLRRLVSSRHEQFLGATPWDSRAPPPMDQKASPPMDQQAPPPMAMDQQAALFQGQDLTTIVNDAPPGYFTSLWMDEEEVVLRERGPPAYAYGDQGH